jgi:hypothetical protein
LPVQLDRAEAEWHASQPPMTEAPTIVEHPIDPELQTGEAAKLGGPISIHAPWRRD